MCILLVFTIAFIHFPMCKSSRVPMYKFLWANAADRENAELSLQCTYFLNYCK
uniref:Uncharacterized protein n=2 Tax=Anguilla anguilla TaxID=7936 RepID=A0A0E9PKL6_ANGAN